MKSVVFWVYLRAVGKKPEVSGEYITPIFRVEE
jgi:hypothetical protein